MNTVVEVISPHLNVLRNHIARRLNHMPCSLLYKCVTSHNKELTGLINLPLFSRSQDAKIEPEEFTNRLQSELKSSPQPYLVPFLKVCTVSTQATFGHSSSWM